MEDMWVRLSDQREQALARRGNTLKDEWNKKTKSFPPLMLGDDVLIKNQSGNHPTRWDKRGVVVECKEFDQYMIRIDGPRCVKRKNRKYLKNVIFHIPLGLSKVSQASHGVDQGSQAVDDHVPQQEVGGQEHQAEGGS